MTTPIDLDHLEKLHAALGPIKATAWVGLDGCSDGEHAAVVRLIGEEDQDACDSAHAEALRVATDAAQLLNDLPALIAEVRASRAREATLVKRRRIRALLQSAIDEIADQDDNRTIHISDKLIAIMRDL